MFVLLAVLRLASVPGELWRWRDDAVITLSHAAGVVDLGSASVSATGERLEAFSAPLQFFVSVAAQSLGLTSYRTFLDLQVAICVFVLGYFTARFIQATLPGAASPDGRADSRVLLGVIAAAATVMIPFVSVGWLASGMENAYSAALLAASAALVLQWQRQGTRGIAAGLALGLLVICRVEFLALAMPLLAVIAWWGWRSRARSSISVVAIPLVIAALVNGWRYVYFGSFVPASGVAQGKSVGRSLEVLLAWLEFGGVALVVGLASWWLARSRPQVAKMVAWVGAVVMFLGWAAVAYATGLIAAPETAGVVRSTVVLALPSLFVAVVLTLAGARLPSTAWIVFALLAVIPLAQVALMGAARLDPLRIATLVLIPLSLLVGALVRNILAPATAAAGDKPQPRRGLIAVGAVVFLGAAAIIPAVGTASASTLCCDLSHPASTILARATDFRVQHDLPMVIVASPDLGELSYPKSVAIEDLGFLGDPVLARLTRDNPDLVQPWVLDVQSPDLVESHFGWSVTYAKMLRSKEFARRYAIEYQEPGELPGFAEAPERGRWTIWQHRSTPEFQREVDLARALAANPASAESLVREAITRCRDEPGDALRCEGVRRSVLRAQEQLRAAGTYDSAADEFNNSPAAALDRALLSSRTNPNWASESYKAFVTIETA